MMQTKEGEKQGSGINYTMKYLLRFILVTDVHSDVKRFFK